VVAAVDAAHAAAPKLPLFAGGKSMGGRMTTTAASEGLLDDVSLRGIVCFGFPLHPAKQPATTRAAHLANVATPTLFLQGTRDDLADRTLMRGVVAGLPKAVFEMHELAGADHGFAVLKSSGRSGAEVLAEAADVAAGFIRERS
jgi:predicted alpha/beta-hydrolase family hydrolase